MKVISTTNPNRAIPIQQAPRGAVVRLAGSDRLYLVAFSTPPIPIPSIRYYEGRPRNYLVDVETGEYQRNSQNAVVIVQDAALTVNGDSREADTI